MPGVLCTNWCAFVAKMFAAIWQRCEIPLQRYESFMTICGIEWDRGAVVGFPGGISNLLGGTFKTSIFYSGTFNHPGLKIKF